MLSFAIAHDYLPELGYKFLLLKLPHTLATEHEHISFIICCPESFFSAWCVLQEMLRRPLGKNSTSSLIPLRACELQ